MPFITFSRLRRSVITVTQPTEGVEFRQERNKDFFPDDYYQLLRPHEVSPGYWSDILQLLMNAGSSKYFPGNSAGHHNDKLFRACGTTRISFLTELIVLSHYHRDIAPDGADNRIISTTSVGALYCWTCANKESPGSVRDGIQALADDSYNC